MKINICHSVRILFILLLFAASSCSKQNVFNDTNIQTVDVSDEIDIVDEAENDADMAAQEAADDAENAYQSEGANTMKLTAVQVPIPGPATIVQAGNCVKYVGQATLDMEHFTRFRIVGVNMGAAQGDSLTLRVFYTKAKGDINLVPTISTWSSTEINFTVPAIDYTLKNAYLKCWITNTKTGKIKKKGIKCVTAVGAQGVADLGEPDAFINYPVALWECYYQRWLNRWGKTVAKGSVTTYKESLKAGDILTRAAYSSDSGRDAGIIMQAANIDANGKQVILVRERNQKCNAGASTRKYTLNTLTGVFALRSGETATWTGVFKTN